MARAHKEKKEKKATSIKERTHLAIGIPLALLSGCLAFLAFPDFGIFPLGWVAFVPLLIAVRGRTFRGGFFLGFLTGFTTYTGGFHWISDLLREFGHMPPLPAYGITLLMTAYQGLMMAVATGLAAHVTFRLRWPWFVVFPILFTACEYLVPFLFPCYMANAQQPFTAITQIVDITGVSGLTFLLIVVNSAFAAIIHWRLAPGSVRFPVAAVGLAVLLFGASLTYGVLRINEIEASMAAAPHVRIGMVEADVGIWEKEAKNPDGSPLPFMDQIRMLYGNLLKHQAMTAQLEQEHHPDLIVWPESSYIPLEAVLSRAGHVTALAASPGGQLFRLENDRLAADLSPGADLLRVTGVAALAARNEADALAVGPRGAAYHFDGQAWVREATGIDRDLLAVAIAGNGVAMAVGRQGTAAIREAGRWRIVEVGTHEDLRAITAMPGGSYFALCGDRGTLRYFNGQDAVSWDAETGANLTAVSYGHSLGLVVAGHDGTLKRFGGTLKTLVTPRVDWTSVGVSGRQIWAVGTGGQVLRCEEDLCTPFKTGLSQNLTAVAPAAPGTALAVGARGTLVMLGSAKIRTIEMAAGAQTASPRPPPDLGSLAFVPFTEGYPMPHDVASIYVSPEPLPEVDLGHPMAAADRDAKTLPSDRNAVMRGFSTPLIFGAITESDRPDHAGERDTYNTALLVDATGRVQGRYDKNYLLLFGEYMPFEQYFPFLRRYFPEAGAFRPGTEVEVFALGPMRMGIMVCYEDILPAFTRRLAGKDPNLLVNITNDAWFGKTAEPSLHLLLATFRSIENRLTMVRSTNTGISAFIDPLGRITQSTAIERPETLVEDVPLLQIDTIYRRHGPLFAYATVVLSGLLVLTGLVVRRKR